MSFYLLLSRLYCRLRNSTGSCLLFAAPVSQRRNCHCPKRLVGFTTDRELHPAPKVIKLWMQLYPYGYDNAIMPWRCSPPGKPRHTLVNHDGPHTRHRWSGQWRIKCHRLRWWIRWGNRAGMRHRQCNRPGFSWSWDIFLFKVWAFICLSLIL